MNTLPQTPPLPRELEHLATEHTRPVHIGSADVALLCVHWGFTRGDGREYVRKLVENEVLKPRHIALQRGLRFVTVEVLQFYAGAVEA